MAYITNEAGDQVGKRYYATLDGAIQDAIERLRGVQDGTVLTIGSGGTTTHKVRIEPLQNPKGARHSKAVITQFWPRPDVIESIL